MVLDLEVLAHFLHHFVIQIGGIVRVIRKNEKMHVCIDFRDLNAVTPKGEYPIIEIAQDTLF